jgi:hypothetical protein
VNFEATLFRWDGPTAWVFLHVPDEHAPDEAGAFGRAPVTATVDGTTWSTSVWRHKNEGWLLPLPVKVRGVKDDGDVVSVAIEFDPSRL